MYLVKQNLKTVLEVEMMIGLGYVFVIHFMFIKMVITVISVSVR